MGFKRINSSKTPTPIKGSKRKDQVQINYYEKFKKVLKKNRHPSKTKKLKY